MKNFGLIFPLILLMFTVNSYKHAQTQNRDLESAVNSLSNFISSNYFNRLSKNTTQLELIDTLYLKAKEYYVNDISESLLALTFATLTFQEMTVTLPILGLKFQSPLPTISDSTFIKRLNNLPYNFLADSPNSTNGDKDKLPHFFGCAFLAYNFEFFNFSKFIGILVELFEEAFKVQGRIDSRDLAINSFGAYYGEILNRNNNVLPSQILQLYSIFFHRHKFH